MNKSSHSNPQELAGLTRFAAVSYVKQLIAFGLMLAEALRQAALRPWPDENTGRLYSVRTIEDWWYAYRKGGYQTLKTKERTDRGASRKLTPEQEHWLTLQRKQYPNIPTSVLYERWKKQDETLPCLSVIYRFFKSRGLDRKSLQSADSNGLPYGGPNKAFESPFPNDLWMVDFSTGPKLRLENGRFAATQLCLIIDDHSRLVPYGAYYENADTQSFHHALKQAVQRRGAPNKLYADNGASFISQHTKIICANLGIRLIHHKPYAAWSKGKIERLFKSVQLGFESTLELPEERVETLKELNAKFHDWIQTTYHRRTHSSTKTTPEERFLQNVPEGQLQVELPFELDKLFYTRSTRKVLKNGIVRLANRLFEVDLSLRGQKVELRYDPFGPLTELEVYFEGAFMGIARQVDLELNSQIARNYDRNRNA